MTSFDSIKILIDHPVNHKNGFIRNYTVDDTGDVVDDKLSLHNQTERPYGVKNIIINRSSGNTIIELSAKILSEDYLEGINLNQLDRIVDTINNSNLISLSSNALDDAEVLRGDINKNISMENVRDAIDALKLGKTNSKFLVTDYNTSANNGIVFQGKQTSYKNRQIYYNKHIEMSMSKNREFIKTIPNQEKFIQSLKHILRVEQNITSRKLMREQFGISENKLLSILKSPSNPVLDRHKRIMKHAKQSDLFKYLDEYDKVQDVISHFGYEGILRRCNYSLDVAEDFLKTFKKQNGKTVYRKLKELRDFYAYYIEKTDDNHDRYLAILEHIENKL